MVEGLIIRTSFLFSGAALGSVVANLFLIMEIILIDG